MKQICKRLSVVFLALVIVSSSVLATGIVVQADTYKILFSDDFNSYTDSDATSDNKNDMNAKGWNTTTKSQGKYNTGTAYEIPHNKGTAVNLSGLDGGSAWTDYSVRATMTLLSKEGASGLTRAGISGRLYSEALNEGYDLLVVKEEVTDIGATLLLRCDGERLLDEVPISRLSNDVPFNLKLEFRGTNVYGYLNDKLMISHDTANDTVKYASGWAGIRKTHQSGLGVLYDDFFVSEIVPGTYPEGYLYHNNFDVDSTLEAAGLYGNGSNTISGGVFNLGSGTYAYLREVVGSLAWEDYTVEADVQMIKGEQDTATKGYAGIVARSTKGKDEGYEFRMDYVNGNKSLSLTKRNGTTTSLRTYNFDFEFNKYYKMTMTVSGNSIMCWIGDTLVFDVEDPDAVTYSKGYAGIRSTGNTANLNSKVDNFSVRQYQAPTVTYPDGHLYFNNFESTARLKNEGWLNDGNKANGVYTLDGSTNNYLTRVNRSIEWTDYVVEADVMINDNGTLPQYAAIVGRSTDTKNNGYELALIKEEGTGNTVVRLYKRGVSSGKINDKINKTNITLEPGKMNSLKMVFDGADIYCYFNGELVFEVTDKDNPYLDGYAGVRSSAGTATSIYDNFAVREIQASDYPPAAVYPEGYLYYNDFSSIRGIDKEGWRNTGTKKDGVYVLEGSKNNYLTKVEGASNWTDYVVEADVVLHDNGEYPQYTGIVGRATGVKNSGYEFILVTDKDGETGTVNTVVRLYKRLDGKQDSGKINGKVNKMNVSVIPNEVHTMKMVVQGATIICYFDGVKIFEVTDKENPYMSGYAGVISATGTAKSSFDYFAVRAISDADIVKNPILTKQDGDIWFYDNFTGEESMTERGWSTDKVALYNGSALVTTRVMVDGIQGSEKWRDYEVSAIVYVDKEAGMLSETASSGVGAIVARSLSSTTGYEFGIMASPSSASYLRLLNRKTGVNIAEDKTIPITAGEHELRMVCIGNEIYCYFDGSLVFAVQNSDNTAGYAGMRAANYNTYYRDFTVRKARPITTTILPSGAISPSTGVSGIYATITNIAFVTLILSVFGLVWTVSYSRRKR